MRKVFVAVTAIVFGGLASMAAHAQEGKVQSLDQLLELVRQGKTAETNEHR
jgi:hypothetical protein